MNFPKVLHVVLKGDGITEVVAEDVNIGLTEARCEITMAYLRENEDMLPETVASHKVGLGVSTRFRFLFDFLALRRLSVLLRDGNYDVVLSHRYKPCVLLMKLVRKFPGVQFVNVVHGTGHYNTGSRKRTIMRLAHERFKFVCVSDAVADFIRTQCGVARTPSSVEVISNGIDIQGLDVQQLSREDARKELGLTPDSLWIGFAGRLTKIKGVLELVEGFAQVAEKHPQAKVAILGKGELCEELQSLIKTSGLQDRVLLVGQVPLARRCFKAFDAFILPSYREGMSIALLEAMATGLPLLVSDIPMNTSLVDESTIVFKPKSSSAVARALDVFLEVDEKKRWADGLHNRCLAEKKYDIRIFHNNYAKLMFELSGK
jgi:glycosyltransferase involved in cell wall biosynthesis